MNYSSIKAALPALALFAATATAQDKNPLAQLIDNVSPSVVTVTVAAEIDIPMMGGSQEIEQSGTGVIVDKSGLIMVDSNLVNPGGGMAMMFGGGDDAPELDVEILSIKVVIGNEPKSLDATVVAKDSKLGLSYLQLAEVGERKLTAQSFIEAKKPQIGDDLYWVGRLSEGFDYAPHYAKGSIIGKIKKPRRAFITGGGFAPGTPVFHKSGELAGVACAISGGDEGGGGMMAMMTGGGGGPRVFIVNAKVCANSVLQALEQAKKAAADKETGGDDK